MMVYRSLNESIYDIAYINRLLSRFSESDQELAKEILLDLYDLFSPEIGENEDDCFQFLKDHVEAEKNREYLITSKGEKIPLCNYCKEPLVYCECIVEYWRNK